MSQRNSIDWWWVFVIIFILLMFLQQYFTEQHHNQVIQTCIQQHKSPVIEHDELKECK